MNIALESGEYWYVLVAGMLDRSGMGEAWFRVS